MGNVMKNNKFTLLNQARFHIFLWDPFLIDIHLVLLDFYAREYGNCLFVICGTFLFVNIICILGGLN